MVIILGPTATGKTSLSVKLAYDFDGEIISADSRQIYKGMDIGTGKALDDYIIHNQQINYHLIDILDPIEDYSVFKFKNDCQNAISKIQSQTEISDSFPGRFFMNHSGRRRNSNFPSFFFQGELFLSGRTLIFQKRFDLFRNCFSESESSSHFHI